MIPIVMKVCLAAFMFTGGVIKILHVPFQVEHWFLTVTGCLEIAGALIMAWEIWNPNLAVAAGILFFFAYDGSDPCAHFPGPSICFHGDSCGDLFHCLRHHRVA